MNELGHQISSDENLGRTRPGFPERLILLTVWGLLAGAVTIVCGGGITCPEQTNEYEGTEIPALLSEASGLWGQPMMSDGVSKVRQLSKPGFVKPHQKSAVASNTVVESHSTLGIETVEREDCLLKQAYPSGRDGQKPWALRLDEQQTAPMINDVSSIHDLNPDLTATTLLAFQNKSATKCATALTWKHRIHYVQRNAFKHPAG